MDGGGYIAVARLRWGDGYIEPGELVPVEEGRNYTSLLRLGRIARVQDLQLSDDQARDTIAKLQARIAELEAGSKPDADLLDLDELPDEVDGVVLLDGRPGREREVDVEDGTQGEYRKRPSATVKAAKLVADVKVLTPHGVMDGHAGDWLLVNTGNGEAWPVDPPYFDANYEPAETGEDAANDGDPLPDGVVETSPGWFELPDGRKVRRKDIPAALTEKG